MYLFCSLPEGKYKNDNLESIVCILTRRSCNPQLFRKFDRNIPGPNFMNLSKVAELPTVDSNISYYVVVNIYTQQVQTAAI